MLETTTTEGEVRIPKRSDINRSGLHVRLTQQHHEKLSMLVKETGRSRREIIEMLIDTAKPGE